MSEEPEQAQHHKGISKEVLFNAVIGAIATILATSLAAVIGLLPNLLAKSDPKPEPTAVAISTPAPPAATDAPATPSAAAQSTSVPTAAAAPAAAGGYPCDATVSDWQAGTLNVVRDFPTTGGQLRDSIQVGTPVQIIDISGTAPPWYRIASPDGRVLGWIPADYLTLAATCPSS